MAPTFREFLEKLRLAADIVEVVGQYVELKQAGSRFKGLCPFHQEKTPSFTVSRDRQAFYCFGCHTGGDAIEFIKRVENLEWRDAVEALAKRYHMEMPRFGGKEEDEQDRKKREALHAINAFAAEWFAEQLRHPARGNAARQYLDRRGLDEPTLRKFGLGLAPKGWDNLRDAAKARGFSEEAAAEAGLLIRNEAHQSYYDRFRERIMFPICDSMGRPIAFGGRVFAPEVDPNDAKYINSPETALYKKGQCLYAFHLARDEMKAKGEAIVLEGYTDVIALHRNGFTNAVASLGTALTSDQARLLRRVCRKVVFLYDDDEAGRNAMIRGTEILLAHEMQVRCVALSEGEDPDSFLRGQGREAFAQRLGQAQPFFEYFLALARRRFDFRTTEGRTGASDLLAPLVRAVLNDIEAEEYVQRLAEALQLAPEVLRAHLRRGAAAPRSRPAPDLREALAEAPREQPHLAELALLRILIDAPALRDILDSFELEWMQDERARAWMRRILERPNRGQTDWQTLLEEGADDEERNFLRQVALMDVAIPNAESMLRQTVARLKKRWHERRALAMAQALRGTTADEELVNDRLREIHDLQRERHAVTREIIGPPEGARES
ncbi:MAG: DNA primase [Candidatus Sumerlaeota bacterium]|nr:DNA primase [Candidatus Sumerlaeota bacterium]